jgi:hypothetical protein
LPLFSFIFLCIFSLFHLQLVKLVFGDRSSQQQHEEQETALLQRSVFRTSGMAQSHVLDLCIFCDFFVEFRKRRRRRRICPIFSCQNI